MYTVRGRGAAAAQQKTMIQSEIMTNGCHRHVPERGQSGAFYVVLVAVCSTFSCPLSSIKMEMTRTGEGQRNKNV